MTVVTFLITIAPLVAFVCLLVSGRYPGERALMRAIGWLRRARQREPLRAALPTPLLVHHSVQGGALIAVSLAGRGPPGGCG